MWSKFERHEFPRRCNVIKTLDSEPKRFCVGLSVTFASKKTAEASHHADGFSQTGGLVWRCGILSCKSIQSLPSGLFKINRARHLWGFASKLGQVKDAPRHHHVDCQTRFNAIGAAELARLHFTAALQGSVINFNAPAPRIPATDRCEACTSFAGS